MFRAHCFYPEPGWATNEKFKVEIPDNFDVQSAIMTLREHLDCVRNHRRCNGLRNGHR
jgi:hypothetical protein